MDPNQFDFDADGNMVGADGHPLAAGRTPGGRARSPGDEGDGAPALARDGVGGACGRDGPRFAEERSPAFGDLAECPSQQQRPWKSDAA